MAMTKYDIAFVPSLQIDLAKAPKKVHNAYVSDIVPLLTEQPETAAPPKIKKLVGYKSLWRIRISDEWRLVYAVEQEKRLVTLLMLGHRKDVYERLDATDAGEPGSRIVSDAEHLLETVPTLSEKGEALTHLATQSLEQKSLKKIVTTELLERAKVPEEFHKQLIGIDNDDALLCEAVQLPAEYGTSLLNEWMPTTIEEVTSQASRLLPENGSLLDLLDTTKGIESFLLRLDTEQSQYVYGTFDKGQNGPWLLKGGPGTGKSTIILYCIRELVKSNSAGLFPVKRSILLTTFTKSLISACKSLLTDLVGSTDGVQVSNVDKMVYAYLTPAEKQWTVPREWEVVELIDKLISSNPNLVKVQAFPSNDSKFVFDEIDEVIYGHGCTKLDDYLNVVRVGRGKPLNPAQRRAFYSFYEIVRKHMHERQWHLFSERTLKAYERAKPQYDFVFIDEAQDLKPIAIRFLLKMRKQPNQVFLTADANQSIYGSGMSWATVTQDLQFKGRARVLRRNYRTTHEVWSAIWPLAPDSEEAGSDKDTILGVEPVYHGQLPSLVGYNSKPELVSQLSAYLKQGLISEKLSPACAAVLSPNWKVLEELAKDLPAELNARVMKPDDFDLSHRGVHLLTMHAAKGLQYSVVAVVGADQGVIPSIPTMNSSDSTLKIRDRRLLFVACSRSMRRLSVFYDKKKPSEYLSLLDRELWMTND